MHSVLRVGALARLLALAVVGVAGLAVASQLSERDAAATEGVSSELAALDADAAVGPTFPDDETTGSIDRSATTSSLPLSDAQLGLVFLGVMNLPDVPESDIAAPAPLAALS